MTHRKNWKIWRTLLIVGEGYTEVAFLSHLKQFPGVCGKDRKITIKTARGKGALGVIQWTGRQIANAHYDQVAVLLDTDTDWSPDVEAIATQKNIRVLTSDPCFEAMLLRVLGQKLKKPKDLKKQFAPFVKNDSTQRENYAENFGIECLHASRAKEETIDGLLKLFGI